MEGNGNHHANGHEEEENGMAVEQKVLLQDLVDQTLLSRNRLAAESGVYTQTIKRALDGEPVQRASALRLLAALNRLLNTSYKLRDIEGLHISGE